MRNSIGRFIAWAIALVAPITPAWCENAEQLSIHGPVYYLLRAIGSLMVVVALILLTYYALQKLRLPSSAAHVEGPMKLLQVLPLSAGRFVYLVALGSRVYVIAWSQEGCTLIGQVDRTEMGDDPGGC
jgi:flagellar biogenesis protein FliO